MPIFNSENSFYLDILEFATQQTAVDLLDAGVDANFINPILNLLNNAVNNGSSLDNLLDELDVYINGGGTGVGALKKYITQVSNDSLTQFNANYNQAVTQDLGFEFYKYTGTVITNTRPFCSDFVNKYYHKKEVEELGLAINPITNTGLTSAQLKGRINGTNSSNIFTRRGGWNCRHYFSPLSVRQVPKKDLKRNLDNGNWQPTELEIDRFLK
jgi:hypothetical protein